jgi:four helix bundle protein
MNSDELKKRTQQFALRVMALSDALPHTPSGRVIAYQLVKSGTSVSANYRAACRGKSKADFISKLGTVLEEADESAFWLELIIAGELLPEARVQPLHQEANELTAIFTTSLKSAKRNAEA